MSAPAWPAGEAPFFAPRVFIPFALVTLVWSATWLVIKDQLGTVAPTWSVTYRFLIAGAAMFAYSLATRVPLGIGREGHLLAAGFGIPQFMLNFNFVYAAEEHITSGIVAVVFALLLVPNSALGRLFLNHRVTPRFVVGSLVAVAGVGLLFLQELRASPASAREVAIGIAFTLAGVLAASISNVMQATERLRARPIVGMLAWGMFYGVLANAAFAFTMDGPPTIETRPGYWFGLAYLGLVASALAFTLYFGVIRAIGPARAAYSSLIVPIIAMGLSTIFEGYVWAPLAVAGGVLAMAGLFIALRARGKAPAA